MKKILALMLSITIIFSFVACGKSNEHEGEAKTPSGAVEQKGRNYEDVVADFEEAGFTDIQLVTLDDLVTGWLTEDGEVESVSVDGNEEYSADEWYPNDTAVVITYHTFPEDEVTEVLESNVDSDSDAESDDDTVLTVENCEELTAIFESNAEIDPAYSEFAEKYKGRTIEFNGCITYLINHDNYDTRYDLLLSAGDYVDENTANPGPIFKFEDVNTYAMGINELFLPDYVSIGRNVHIVVEVKSFNSDTGLFFLKPVSITER